MSSRDVVRVCGPDAISFLQGQVSQDVEGLAVGASAPSFVLSPQGRVDAWVELRRTGDDTVELVVDDGFGDALEQRLRRFLLRTKATIERAEEGGPEIDEAERIERGIPAMGREIDERTIPAETGWVPASVSFTKGCFVGQELVARMDSRVAEPPRHLVRLRVDGGDPVAPATPIEGPDGAAGEVTSAASTGDVVVALGYVKRGTAHDAAFSVAGRPAVVEGVAGA